MDPVSFASEGDVAVEESVSQGGPPGTSSPMVGAQGTGSVDAQACLPSVTHGAPATLLVAAQATVMGHLPASPLRFGYKIAKTLKCNHRVNTQNLHNLDDLGTNNWNKWTKPDVNFLTTNIETSPSPSGVRATSPLFQPRVIVERDGAEVRGARGSPVL